MTQLRLRFVITPSFVLRSWPISNESRRRRKVEFEEQVRRLQREYYFGRADRPTVIATLNELMHYCEFLGSDEELISIPSDFGADSRYGIVGEFVVRTPEKTIQFHLLFQKPAPNVYYTPIDQNYRSGFDTVFQGASGKRYRLTRLPDEPPPLSEADQKFFASYEREMAKEIAKGGQGRTAQFI